MDAAKVRELIFRNASEEAGLFEVIWDLGTEFPESQLCERYQVAVATIQELVEHGWIELFTFRWKRGAEGDYQPVPANAVPSTLQQPQSWYPNNGTPPIVERVVLTITEEVRAAWSRRQRQII